GLLKAGDEFGSGFGSPAVEEYATCQGRDEAARSDEFPVIGGKGTERRELVRVTLSPGQGRRVAFAACVLIGDPARLGLSRGEDAGGSRLLAGQNGELKAEKEGRKEN